MTGEQRPDKNEVDMHHELYQVLRTHILGYGKLLLLEAVAKEHLSEEGSSKSRLPFMDRYVTHAPLERQGQKTLAILLTPNGERMLPSRPVPHFFLYFNDDFRARNVVDPLTAIGITHTTNETTTKIMVNETDVYDIPDDTTLLGTGTQEVEHIEVPDGNGVLFIPKMALPPPVPYDVTRGFFKELQAYQVAPQNRAPRGGALSP